MLRRLLARVAHYFELAVPVLVVLTLGYLAVLAGALAWVWWWPMSRGGRLVVVLCGAVGAAWIFGGMVVELAAEGWGRWRRRRRLVAGEGHGPGEELAAPVGLDLAGEDDPAPDGEA